MPTLQTRLDRLRLVYRRPEPRPSAFDAARLTPAEWEELDGILAPLATLSGAPLPIDRLTDAQLDRACELSRKGDGLPPEPAYFGMRHRDAGIGPCRCAGCERAPTPAA